MALSHFAPHFLNMAILTQPADRISDAHSRKHILQGTIGQPLIGLIPSIYATLKVEDRNERVRLQRDASFECSSSCAEAL